MLIIQQAIKIIAVSALQVAVFIFFYEAFWEIYMRIYGSLRGGVSYGVQLDQGVNLLSILAAVNSLTLTVSRKAKTKWMIVVSLAAIWLIYWSNIIERWPNRFLLISVLGIIGLLSGVLSLANGNSRE